MFGLGIGWVKALIFVAVLTAIGSVVYGGYRHINGLNNTIAFLTTDNATFKANQANLEQAIMDQKETIASLEADAERQNAILRDTLDEFSSARDSVDDLQDRLGRHEIGFLAIRKPGLVENVINNAADSIGRCFEIASGSPLTEAEIAATLPSQINNECPDLANPNFRDD